MLHLDNQCDKAMLDYNIMVTIHGQNNELSIIPDSGDTVHDHVNQYHIFHKRNVGGHNANIEQ